MHQPIDSHSNTSQLICCSCNQSLTSKTLTGAGSSLSPGLQYAIYLQPESDPLDYSFGLSNNRPELFAELPPISTGVTEEIIGSGGGLSYDKPPHVTVVTNMVLGYSINEGSTLLGATASGYFVPNMSGPWTFNLYADDVLDLFFDVTSYTGTPQQTTTYEVGPAEYTTAPLTQGLSLSC